MLHWIWTAIDTYGLHPLKGAGYQWWSGEGSDLSEITLFAMAWKYLNCQEPGCMRVGHRHPGHGRPVCRKHYRSTNIRPQ